MRYHELFEYSVIDPGIGKALSAKGYKPLGKRGGDQAAYLEPISGYVLKIFGTNDDAHGNKFDGFTKSQRAFKVFADYCNSNPNNKFLPYFSDWATFNFKNNQYLQIRMERLFEIKYDIGSILEMISELVRFHYREVPMDKLSQVIIDHFEDDATNEDSFHQLLIHIGDDFDQLIKTLSALDKIAKSNRLILDLHAGNWMYGSDGHIVISDPFTAI